MEEQQKNRLQEIKEDRKVKWLLVAVSVLAAVIIMVGQRFYNFGESKVTPESRSPASASAPELE